MRPLLLHLGAAKATPYALILAAGVAAAQAQTPARPQAWPTYAADNAATHFSPLQDIERTNVSSLSVAWEWSTGEEPKQDFGAQPGNFQNTPLMIDNVLYVSTPYNRVVALEADTGKESLCEDQQPACVGKNSRGGSNGIEPTSVGG